VTINESTLVFDIEPFPTSPGCVRLYEVDSAVSDKKWRRWPSRCAARRPAATSCNIICKRSRRSPVCCARATTSGCGPLGDPGEDEGSLIKRFFDGIEKYTPQLVSWNGGGFDLPVLHYRGLIHGIQCRATGTWARTTATSSGTTTSAATTRAIST